MSPAIAPAPVPVFSTETRGRKPGRSASLLRGDEKGWTPNSLAGLFYFASPEHLWTALWDCGRISCPEQLRLLAEIGMRLFGRHGQRTGYRNVYTEPIEDAEFARILRISVTQFRRIKKDTRDRELADMRMKSGEGQRTCYKLNVEKWATAALAPKVHGRAAGAPIGVLPRDSVRTNLLPGKSKALRISDRLAISMNNRSSSHLQASLETSRDDLIELSIEDGVTQATAAALTTSTTPPGSADLLRAIAPLGQFHKFELNGRVLADLEASLKAASELRSGLTRADLLKSLVDFITPKIQSRPAGTVTAGLLMKIGREDFPPFIEQGAFGISQRVTQHSATDELFEEMMAEAADDKFSEFQAACIAAKMTFSIVDLTAARTEWQKLTPTDQARAVEGLKQRTMAGEFNDPAFRPLPHNYLRNRIFERDVRPAPVPRKSKTQETYDRLEQKYREADEAARKRGLL